MRSVTAIPRFLFLALTRGLRWCDERFFTVLAIVVGLYCLLFVPQVSHLIRQGPIDRFERVLFGSLVLLLALFYVVTLLDILWPLPRGWITGWTRFVNDWLVSIADLMQPYSSGRRGYFLPVLMMCAGLGLAWWIPFDLNLPYQLAGGVLKGLAIWIALVGFFLLYGKIIGPKKVVLWAQETRNLRRRSQTSDSDNEPPQRGSTQLDMSTHEARSGWDRLGAVLSWVFVTTAIGELFWVSAVLEWPFASLRLYTIWALIHIVVAATVFGGVIDFFHRYTVLPARAFAVAVLILLAWFQGGEVVRDGRPEALVAPEESSARWLAHLKTRLNEMPEGPVVLVAASGGGSRAALFTSLVFQMLDTEPMTLPPIEPSPNRQLSTGMQIAAADSAAWADHILMISSVSGGSMAAAHYVEQRWRGDVNTAATDRLRFTGRRELIRRTDQQIEAWMRETSNPDAEESARLEKVLAQVRRLNTPEQSATASASGSGREPANDTGLSSESPERSAANDDSAAGRLQAIAATATDQRLTDITRMAFREGLADDMSADFMAPMLRGFLTPFSSRGQGLYLFWQSQFGWTGQRLDRDFEVDDMKRRPLVLLNVTDIDSGRRVIFGQPPLPAGLWDHARAGLSPRPRFSPLAGENVYAPVTAGALGGPELEASTLARAVRLSSNFPFGFHVAEIPVSGDTAPAAAAGNIDEDAATRVQKSAHLRLIDGGVVDNTGIDSLHAVFLGLHRSAVADPTGDEAQVLREIRRRGVVLVEIDSGAKPSTASRFTPFAGLARPISALNNAIYTNSVRSGDALIQDLNRLLSGWMPSVLLLNPRRDSLEVPVGGATIHVPTQELDWAVPAVAADHAPESMLQGFQSVRFVCNHVSRAPSHVMTALALGPQDKATVIAQFLDQAHIWQEGAPERLRIARNTQNNASKMAVSSDTDSARIDAVRNLVQAAATEMQAASASLHTARDTRWHGPPRTPEQLDEAVEILRRPYVLLMGVRAISDLGSEEFLDKGQQLTSMQRMIQDLFDGVNSPEAAVEIAYSSELAPVARSDAPAPGDDTNAEPSAAAPPDTDTPPETANAGSELLELLKELPAPDGTASNEVRNRLRENQALQQKMDARQQRTSRFYK